MQALRILFVATLPLILSAILGFDAMAQKGKPHPPPDPAIAYIAGTLTGDLMVMNADGSNRQKIFDEGVLSNHAPSWSPDGSQLAVMQSAGPYQNWISVLDKDGSNRRDVIATSNFLWVRPAWSPLPLEDGNYKILFRDEEGSGVNQQSDLYLVNLDGTGLVNLTGTPEYNEISPTWAPTTPARFAAVRFPNAPYASYGDLIVYDVVYENNQFSAVVSLNLTSNGPLTGVGVDDPAWAKTQDKIAVAAFGDIWVIDVANPYNPVRLTNTGTYSERFPSWSADDSQVVYSRTPHNASRKEKPGIFVINADGTGTKALVYPSDGSWLDWRRCCQNCATVCAP
jgi:dipeptidyl aminopeptidase/acylaminoacyl peptidase